MMGRLKFYKLMAFIVFFTKIALCQTSVGYLGQYQGLVEYTKSDFEKRTFFFDNGREIKASFQKTTFTYKNGISMRKIVDKRGRILSLDKEMYDSVNRVLSAEYIDKQIPNLHVFKLLYYDMMNRPIKIITENNVYKDIVNFNYLTDEQIKVNRQYDKKMNLLKKSSEHIKYNVEGKIKEYVKYCYDEIDTLKSIEIYKDSYKYTFHNDTLVKSKYNTVYDGSLANNADKSSHECDSFFVENRFVKEINFHPSPWNLDMTKTIQDNEVTEVKYDAANKLQIVETSFNNIVQKKIVYKEYEERYLPIEYINSKLLISEYFVYDEKGRIKNHTLKLDGKLHEVRIYDYK
ncbi:hypothetical protein [Polluticaenibacter yanchengensis]|uniref:Uncharacterized protein n=1 Tax=Polluticaenibacter yanchengensis TaxID=3014562 RepID=A0ABT4UPY8_9BACT|nr:hypothetical protein [Chitinophagaceae bacterium LY-5]